MSGHARQRARTRTLLRDRRGATLVEFAIAMGPLLMMLFCFLQVGYVYAAHLVFHHAAMSAARMAIVGKSAMQPGAFVGNAGDERLAALEALGDWAKLGDPAIDDVQVKTPYPSTDPYGPVQVEVTGTYHCNVPLGRSVVCGRGVKAMKETIVLPHQGARYAQE